MKPIHLSIPLPCITQIHEMYKLFSCGIDWILMYVVIFYGFIVLAVILSYCKSYLNTGFMGFEGNQNRVLKFTNHLVSPNPLDFLSYMEQIRRDLIECPSCNFY